jgi:TonB family protein
MVFKGDSTLVDTSGAMSGDIRLIDLIGSPQDNKTPGGEKDSLPDKAKRNEFLHPELGSDSVPKRAGGPPADSLAPDSIRNKALPEPQSQQAKEHLQDSLRIKPGNNKAANPQDTASHSGPIKLHNALTDTTSGQVTDSLGHPVAPRDNKRISLKNFPLPHSDTLQNSSADSLAQPKDTLNAGVPVFARDSLGNPIELSDSLAGGSMASDSTQVDSTEVVVVDSSMIWLFQHLAQKYQGTDIGTEAERLAKGETVARKAPKLKQPGRPELVAAQAAPDTTQAAADTTTSPFAIQDTTLQAQAIEDSLKAEIDRWPLMQYEPITAPEFEYPIEAATSKFQGRVVTEIKIDFDGRVTDVKILKGSNVPLIDQEVKNTLLETYFDPMKIDPLHLGSYFIYNYEITLPEVYK